MVAGEVLEAYELTGGRLTLESKGLLRVVLKRHEAITADHIREMHDVTIHKIGKRLPVLIDQRAIKRMNRDARELAASSEIAEFTERLAVLIGRAPVSVFIGNFFVRVTRPPYPICLFEMEEEALQWLLPQIRSPQS